MAKRASKRIKAQPEARRPKKLIDGQRTYKADGKVILTHAVGALPILNRILKRMNLHDFLSRHLPSDKRTKVDTPRVLLLDEPFAAVDRPVRRRLQDEIDGLRRTLDMPLILVTHDFEDVVRLATHLLIVDQGRRVAYGALADLMSRPDLYWLREAVGLGSVFDAVVARTHRSRGLVELAFDGGTLLAVDRSLTPGTVVRLRVPAREVILATKGPEGLSLHNVLFGRVSAIDSNPAFDHVIVQITVGRVLLLAEVTRDAIRSLGIEVGIGLHALIKSVSIEVLTAHHTEST